MDLEWKAHLNFSLFFWGGASSSLYENLNGGILTEIIGFGSLE